jgi:hypothetical protein
MVKRNHKLREPQLSHVIPAAAMNYVAAFALEPPLRLMPAMLPFTDDEEACFHPTLIPP